MRSPARLPLLRSWLPLEDRTAPATLVVTSLADAVTNDGQLTLREAIIAANTDTTIDGATGSGNDIIQFASNLAGGTLTLNGTELPAITNQVTIVAPTNSTIIIDASASSRILTVNAGTGAILSGLTLQNGNAAGSGGAVLNNGLMTVAGCTFRNNTATGDGGGLWTSGVVSIGNSAFHGNAAGLSGGGIGTYAGGTTTITNTTVSGNTAVLFGGGLDVNSATLTMVNATVARNRAQATDGGTGFGGGFTNFGTTTLHNTIVAENLIGSGSTADDIRGNANVVAASASNLIGNAATAGGLTNGTNGNQVGVAPLLAALASNGGPTVSHALPATSPAVGKGDASKLPAGTTADQRGAPFARFVGPVDVGAFELRPLANPMVVDSVADDADGDISAGKFTLREAIALANGTAEPDAITFADALAGQTIFLAQASVVGQQGLQAIATDMTITAPAAGAVTISRTPGAGDFRLITVVGPANVSLTGLTITNPTPDSPASAFSGGLANFGGVVTLTDMTFTGNVSNLVGAAIFNAGRMTISGGSVSGNTAGQGGGGIWNDPPGVLVANNLTVAGNTAGQGGGGIANVGDLTVTNSTISGNGVSAAGFAGGGLQNKAGAVATLVSVTLADNAATANGGGASNAGTITYVNCTVVNNRADSDGNGGTGGGIEAGGSAFAYNTLVSGNVAVAAGADVPNEIGGTLQAGASNIVFDPTLAGGLVNGTDNNQVGGFESPVVAADLADNGGPTLTLAIPVENFAAIGKGDKTLAVKPGGTVVRPTAVTSATAGSDLYPASQLIDGSGLSGTPTAANYPTITHGSSAPSNAWVTAAPGGEPSDYFATAGAPPVVLTFALGKTYTVTDLLAWGYSNSGGEGNEAQTLRVAFSTDGGATFGTPVTVTRNRTGLSAQRLPLGVHVANAVRITVIDNFFGAAGITGGDRVGLSEVRFLTADLQTNDQRGFLRPADPQFGPEVGAYQRQYIVLAPETLANARAGEPYSQLITASSAGLPGTTYTFAAFGELPAGLTISPDGLLSGTANVEGSGQLGFTATAATGDIGYGALNITFESPNSPPPPPPPGTQPPLLVGVPQFGVGLGGGTAATVQFFNPDQSQRFATTAFAGFAGSVRTASADFNADGVPDLVVGTGPGQATRVRVIDGVTQKDLFATGPFEASFVGGVYVACGDINGDGTPDLVITPDEGGGPRVDIYSGAGFGKIASFFGIDDPNFRGGCRPAVADFTADNIGDVVVAAGFGGGPRVAVFDGKTVATTRTRVFGDFFMFEETLRNGAFVAAGDFDGDGVADLACGGGPGGGQRVTVYRGASLLTNQYIPLANFFAGNATNRGGVRLAVKTLDADGLADLVTGSGAGGGSRVTAYAGAALSNAPPELFAFDAQAGFSGGVFVG